MTGKMHDIEAILAAWAAGETSSAIAQRVGSSPGYVRTIVKKARENGDQRADLRRNVPGKARTLDHEAILDRWAAGWRAEEIAQHVLTSAETIYDILMAHRRRGDPRAVRRRAKNGLSHKG